MYRGTTPTLVFELPFAASELTAVSIAMCQNDELVLEKTLSDCTLEDNQLSVTLTESDTLALESGVQLAVQLRCACGESYMASKIVQVPVERILKDGALT